MKLAEPLYISEDLEQGLIAGVIHGVVSLDSVPTTALSKNGKAVVSGIEFLQASGSKAPYAVGGVLTAACDVAGAEKGILEPYLIKATKANWGKEAGAIAQKLCEQTTLSELANEINRQMAAREFDPGKLTSKLTTKKAELAPASSLLVGGKLPPIPSGYDIPSLPMLTKASGGVMGVWCVGGRAKAGKSTLGVQIALEMPLPVLYYDMENGENVMLSRIGKAFGGDFKKTKKRLERFYMRRNIKTLYQDLAAIPAPALVVIDSVQKLPTKQDQRRTGIDHWLLKLERLKEDGYTVLLISEVNGLGGYKETSEIEYTVDFGMQLRKQDGIVIANVVANRHRPDCGDLCTMERVNDFWFTEAEDLGSEGQSEEGAGL